MMKSSSTNNSQGRPFMLSGMTIEPLLNLISRDGQHFQVERQVMLLLLHFVENVDQVITRESILASLWKNSIPSDEALTQAVSKLRKALGDCPSNGRIIQTIRKVGYRLNGPVSPVIGPSRDSANERVQLSPWKWAAVIALTLFTTILLNVVTIRTNDSGDPSSIQGTTMVRLIISRDHDQLTNDMDNRINRKDIDTIEQRATTGQP